MSGFIIGFLGLRQIKIFFVSTTVNFNDSVA
jgi:hypothetical protein